MKISMAFLLPLFFLSFASCSAIRYEERAGGPSFAQLPGSCSVVNPLYCSGGCSGVQASSNIQVNTSTIQSAQVYAYYLPADYAAEFGAQFLLQRCLSICYGYGTADSSCVSVFQAYNVPEPAVDGSPGGNPTLACLLFNRNLGVSDFQLANNASIYTNANAGNINCGVGASNAGGTYNFTQVFNPTAVQVSLALYTPVSTATSTLGQSSSWSSGISTTATCPSGAIYTDPASSDTFNVECGNGYSGYNVSVSQNVPSFASCLSLCANTTSCEAGIWNSVNGTCYLKYALGRIITNSALWGGIMPNASIVPTLTSTSMSTSVSMSSM